jgi:type IV secretion system protein TrbC
MKFHRLWKSCSNAAEWIRHRPRLTVPAVLLLASSRVYAQSDPWENAVQVLQTAFTGPIARGLALVAIVVGGLMFAFGEGQSKKMLAGIVFGVGMAIGAVNFMAWLFP